MKVHSHELTFLAGSQVALRAVEMKGTWYPGVNVPRVLLGGNSMWGLGPVLQYIHGSKLSRVLYISRKTECVLDQEWKQKYPHTLDPDTLQARVCFHLPLLRFHLEEKPTRICQRRSMKWLGVMPEVVSLRSPSPQLYLQGKAWSCLENASLQLLTHRVSLKCRGVLISGYLTSGDECGLRIAGVMRVEKACLLRLSSLLTC